ITFALPASTPERQHSANPPAPSFLNRIGRKLSQSKTQLVRKVSKGAKTPSRKNTADDKENRGTAEEAATPAARSSVEQSPQSPESPESPVVPTDSPAKGAGLKRGLRVSVMRRTKSEGRRKAGGIASEEQKMEDLVRRANGVQPPAVDHMSWTEVHSALRSYFWSDSLGVCWDGREQVHPDLVSFQPYSSDCDVLPRVVYASTLSTFPPRPPLRPRTPPQLELTPASQIIAEYRARHGTLTPGTVVGCDSPLTLDEEDNAATTNAGLVPPDTQLHRRPTPTDDGTLRPRYSPSIASDHSSAYSTPASATFAFGSGINGGPLSEDSSTSIESMTRGGEDEGDATRVEPMPKRFKLVDEGPVPRPFATAAVVTAPSVKHSPTILFDNVHGEASSIEDWRECDE
ncbi:hypothetical protein JCM21900_001464, partial [Sporobolomyces salmonicolor]